MSTGQAPGYHTSEDEKLLHKLGYAQELFRAMGGFQNFAISFTIISILAGCLTSYVIAYGQGGPVAVTWGWLIVGAMSTLVALAMAEIASSFPTAGGLYYWSSKLGNPGWGWFTGWFNLVGQIAVTASIGYGLAIFGTALLNYWFDYPNSKEYVYLTYAVVLLGALVLNLMKITVTAMLNTISAYWHMIGVGVVVVVLLAVPDEHRSFGSIFTDTINATGWGGDPAPTSFNSIVFWYVFLTGLLMAQYTITGFDASAHVAEETHSASRSAAVGMYTSVVASVFFGFILLIAVTLALPAEPTIDLYIIPTSWVSAMGQSWGTFLLFICCVAQFFCLTASVTSASRMLFAFSRDRAVPGHQLWRRVARNRIPNLSVIAIVVASAVLMLPTLYNFFIGYYVGTGIAVIGLYIAFILPVILRYRMKDRFEPGAWTLGNHYKWIDPIAIVWVFFICIVFLMPPYSISAPWKDGFTWEAVNYAPLLVGGALLLFGGWWVVSAKNWFKGPVRMGTEEELERMEEAQLGQFELPTEVGA
jgi:amino acid transporter